MVYGMINIIWPIGTVQKSHLAKWEWPQNIIWPSVIWLSGIWQSAIWPFGIWLYGMIPSKLIVHV